VSRVAPRERPQCGRDRGYRLHLEAGEYPCEPCLEAHREDGQRWRHARYGPPPAPQPCGTDASYKRHLRRGEVPCWRCRIAHRMAEAERARRRRDRGDNRVWSATAKETR